VDLAAAYRADPREARHVNAAIDLRRPLLVTGLPGTGSPASHSPGCGQTRSGSSTGT